MVPVDKIFNIQTYLLHQIMASPNLSSVRLVLSWGTNQLRTLRSDKNESPVVLDSLRMAKRYITPEPPWSARPGSTNTLDTSVEG